MILAQYWPVLVASVKGIKIQTRIGYLDPFRNNPPLLYLNPDVNDVLSQPRC